jgi:ribose transport system permease protein
MSNVPNKVIETEGEVVARSGSPSPPPSSPSSRRIAEGSLFGLVPRQLLLLGSFVVILVFFSIENPGLFATWSNFKNLLNELPTLGILAMAVTVVLALGEFDLSVPNVASLTSIVVAILVTQTGVGVGIAILIGIAVAVTAGSVNGTAVGFGRASPFIVTLAVGSIASGLELFVQSKLALGQTSITQIALPMGLRDIATSKVAGVNLSVYLTLALAVLLGLVLVHGRWGRHLQAIGGNEDAARLAGVPIRTTKVIAFIVAALCAGVAGVLFTARSGYYPLALSPYLLTSYAAAFFGATAVGKRGFSIPATLFGVVYLSVLANGLQTMNQPAWVTAVVQGVVLFVTVLLARTRV